MVVESRSSYNLKNRDCYSSLKFLIFNLISFEKLLENLGTEKGNLNLYYGKKNFLCPLKAINLGTNLFNPFFSSIICIQFFSSSVS